MTLILFKNVILDWNGTKVKVRYVFLGIMWLLDIRRITLEDSLILKNQKPDGIYTSTPYKNGIEIPPAYFCCTINFF